MFRRATPSSLILKTMSTAACPRIFPIVVMGATGVGKSKLAIEIAQKFDGEVINADSMQIYKGLDIATNKVTQEERRLARHHLMDYVDPAVDVHTVVDFRNEALPVIDELLRKGKTPVICGGTMYYIEALLWEVLIPSGGIPDPAHHLEGGRVKAGQGGRAGSGEGGRAESGEGGRAESGEEEREDRVNVSDEDVVESEKERRKPTKKEIDSLDELQLYAQLKKCDPETASRLHPNDKRKVLRALQIFQSRGVKMSECLKEQHKDSSSQLRGPLRYSESLMFWVESEASVLNQRLDDRVDKMVESGMLEEMLQFHHTYNEERIQSKDIGVDYTGGIFQSIGFKEFHKYLTMSSESRESFLGQKAFEEGIDLLKLHTRQYTKSQRKWIKNRFLKKSHPNERIPPVYKVDSTNVQLWNENVRDRVFSLLRHLRDEPRLKGETRLDADVCGESAPDVDTPLFENRVSSGTKLSTDRNSNASPSSSEDSLRQPKVPRMMTASTSSPTPSPTSPSKEPLLRPEGVTLRLSDLETTECAICRKCFTSQDQMEIHFQSKQHRKEFANLNAKRRELSTTMRFVETKKREEQKEQQQQCEVECLPCKRKFDSEEKLLSHVTSKKHKKKATASQSGATTTTTTTTTTEVSEETPKLDEQHQAIAT